MLIVYVESGLAVIKHMQLLAYYFCLYYPCFALTVYLTLRIYIWDTLAPGLLPSVNISTTTEETNNPD